MSNIFLTLKYKKIIYKNKYNNKGNIYILYLSNLILSYLYSYIY